MSMNIAVKANERTYEYCTVHIMTRSRKDRYLKLKMKKFKKIFWAVINILVVSFTLFTFITKFIDI